jgi:hydrophobic/amphiphilic exporter-1 (mainly G- bacteria), HAE1 family
MSLPRFSVRNEVIVNVLMVVILLGGAAFSLTLTREMFPESRPDKILVSAIYPGVQPAEIEKAVTIQVEEAVRDVDGIEKVESTISEGGCSTILTLRNEVADVDPVLQDIKTELDALDNLPDELQSITVRKLVPKLPVIGIALYGDADDAALKRAARDLRDDLLRLPGITEVEIGGVRDDEISVEVQPDQLLKYDVTFQEVAAAIRQTNLDVSGGQLKGGRTNIAVRTLGEETRGIDLESIEITTRPDGAVVRLRDVAEIVDGFVDSDAESWFNGQRAINLLIYKVARQDVLEISETVKAYIKGKQRESADFTGWNDALAQPWYWRPFALVGVGLWRGVVAAGLKTDTQAIYERSLVTPFNHNLDVALHTDLARYLRGRLDLMLTNGQQGFILVMVSLLLFLNWRLAFWTAWGIPTSFLGSFFVMWLFGVSINLISLFGMIIVLGIIVDDAIVIGENIYRHIQEGMPPRQAAIVGAEEVMWPVIASVTTTIGAFAPLMFMEGQIGDFFRELPLVIMAALSVSLLEALLILPAHLKHLPDKAAMDAAARWEAVGWRRPVQQFVQQLGTWWSHSLAVRVYERVLYLALSWRYVTLGLAVALLVSSFGLVIGGVVEFVFIQKMDSESMICNLKMPVGTPAATTRDRLQRIVEKARQVPEIVNVQMHVAVQFGVGAAGAESVSGASHLGQLIIELKAADERERLGERNSEQVLAELRTSSEALPGINSCTWEALSGAPGGKEIELVLSGPRSDELESVALDLKRKLAGFEGAVDVDDNFDRGKREVQIDLRESARPTGITVGQIGEHVRSAMYGAEARRVTRNREDVKIMVRYPPAFRESVYNLESMWIPSVAAALPSEPDASGSSASGAGRTVPSRWVPLGEVAQLTDTEGYGTLHRSQQLRSVRVSADVMEGANSENIRQELLRYYQQELQPKHPDIQLEMQGVAEELSKSMTSLKKAAPLALLIIYAIVASVFRSYYQPIVVMLSIPFGIQGAILGHWLTGYPMTIISGIGFVALTGIVVNDAIVLIDYVNNRIRQGFTPFEANLEGSKTRLRAIFLTSATTIAGLLPIMSETSFQAKFLIPMAVTIIFGLLFSTIQTLVIAPSINMIFFDVLQLLGIKPVPEQDE